MRYWMINGDGKTYGPYSIEELRSMMVSGPINDRCMLCVEGTQRWGPARTLLATFREPTSPASEPRTASVQYPTGAHASPSPVGPILATIFCCMPLGLVSPVQAANANVKATRGDIVGAMGVASRSRAWMMVATVPTFALAIIYMVLTVRRIAG